MCDTKCQQKQFFKNTNKIIKLNRVHDLSYGFSGLSYETMSI